VQLKASLIDLSGRRRPFVPEKVKTDWKVVARSATVLANIDTLLTSAPFDAEALIDHPNQLVVKVSSDASVGHLDDQLTYSFRSFEHSRSMYIATCWKCYRFLKEEAPRENLGLCSVCWENGEDTPNNDPHLVTDSTYEMHGDVFFRPEHHAHIGPMYSFDKNTGAWDNLVEREGWHRVYLDEYEEAHYVPYTLWEICPI
jgi:hypothetical protein